MNLQIPKMSLTLKTDTRALYFTLSGPNIALRNTGSIVISDASPAPLSNTNAAPIVIQQREAEMIDHLLDVCSHYSDQGDPDLSRLVDRIGMTLMQVFLERARNGIVITPPEPLKKY